MKRFSRWFLPLLGIGQLLLARAGVLDGRLALLTGAVLEVLLLLVGVRQILLARRAYRRERAAGFDIWVALEDGLAVLMPRPIARLAVLEPKLWYCLGRWLARRRVGANEYAYQQRALIGPVLILAFLTLPAELLAVELLIPSLWLRTLLAIGSLYSLLWLVGFYASLRVLPHRLEPGQIRIRFGAFAEGVIPYDTIVDIALERRRTPGGRDGLQLAPGQEVAYLGTGGRTDITLTLCRPLVLRGLRGPTAPVTLICLAADEPERLVRELAHRSGRIVNLILDAAPTSYWRDALHFHAPQTRRERYPASL